MYVTCVYLTLCDQLLLSYASVLQLYSHEYAFHFENELSVRKAR